MRLSDYGQIDRGNAVSFRFDGKTYGLSLIHISEPTRPY